MVEQWRQVVKNHDDDGGGDDDYDGTIVEDG